MRFLHTSDWHLGKSLKGRSRIEEHESALSEILDIAQREKIDSVLITGDIFDSQAPPPEAERLARLERELAAHPLDLGRVPPRVRAG